MGTLLHVLTYDYYRADQKMFNISGPPIWSTYLKTPQPGEIVGL